MEPITATPAIAVRASSATDVRDLRHPSLMMGTACAAAILLVGVAAALGPQEGLAAIGVVALGLAVLQRPAVGALILVGLAPALTGVRRDLPVPGFRLSELLIVGIAALILLTARRETTVRWTAFDWIALTYVVATPALGAFNLLQRGAEFNGDNVGSLLGPLQFFLLYRAVVTALPRPEQRSRAIRILLVASVPVSILALLQQFDIGNARVLVETITGTDIYATTATPGAEAVPRATGPFPHWHGLGGYLFIVILLGFALLLEGSGRVMRRRTLLLVLIPAVAALIQTASIAPIFGALAGLLLIGVWIRRMGRVLLWITASAAVGALLFGALLVGRFNQQFATPPGSQERAYVPETIAFRYDVWKQFVPTIKSDLITGYGPDLPSGLYFPFTESLYISLMLRGGIPLMAVYLALVWAFASRAHAASRRGESEQRVAGRVLLATVILLVFIHIIATYFIDSGAAHLVWALAGLLAVRPASAAARADSSTDRGQPASAGRA